MKPDTQSGTLTLAVVIPVYGPAEYLEHCVNSVRQQSPAVNEIIIAGDGPNPAAATVAVRTGAHYLETARRGGPGAARNLGASAAASDLVWFIDADVTVPPGAARQVLDFFAGHPHAALFGSYDDTPSQPGLLSQYRNLLHHYTHQHGCPEAVTFWAGCGVFRRDRFLALGGFDPAFTHPSVEDIELGLRARRAGDAIRLDKTLLCTHHKTWRIAALIRDDITRRAAPWTRLLLRERRLPNDLNLGHGQRASVVLAGLLPVAIAALAQSAAAAITVLACATGLLALNADFYRFLAHRRGLWFTVRAIPCHWLYFICAGCGGLLGTAQFLINPVPVNRNG